MKHTHTKKRKKRMQEHYVHDLQPCSIYFNPDPCILGSSYCNVLMYVPRTFPFFWRITQEAALNYWRSCQELISARTVRSIGVTHIRYWGKLYIRQTVRCTYGTYVQYVPLLNSATAWRINPSDLLQPFPLEEWKITLRQWPVVVLLVIRWSPINTL